jgi:hypothetical protein
VAACADSMGTTEESANAMARPTLPVHPPTTARDRIADAFGNMERLQIEWCCEKEGAHRTAAAADIHVPWSRPCAYDQPRLSESGLVPNDNVVYLQCDKM